MDGEILPKKSRLFQGIHNKTACIYGLFLFDEMFQLYYNALFIYNDIFTDHSGYKERNMSRYDDEIADLIAYFKEQLVTHESFNITEEEYQNGWDSLPSDSLKDMVRKAFDKWLSERSYELSYKQVCVSFFQAARELEKFTLMPRHPIFRLGTHVLIKQVCGEGGIEENVPGCIISVRGDEHIVMITASLWGQKSGSFCEVIHTNDLEARLCLAKN